MEFGRVAASSLNHIDFTLPPEPAFNKAVLRGIAVPSPKIYVGCAKWGRKEWIGKLYPPKTKEKDFLEQYVQHYNSIELNATHYKIYDAATIEKWTAKAQGKDFLFCPKMYQGVTHYGSLSDKHMLTNEFLHSISNFGKYLGPVFIQVSDTFAPTRKHELFAYLQSLPTDIQFFMEVRHPGWFEDVNIREELFHTLKAMGIGAVITDTSGRRDCAHMYVTVPRAFIRFVANSLHPTDYTRIDDWISSMQLWLENGMEVIYFFMHMHDEALSPELTLYLIDRLNTINNVALAKPAFLPTPLLLF